jgi:hypothetical protein
MGETQRLFSLMMWACKCLLTTYNDWQYSHDLFSYLQEKVNKNIYAYSVYQIQWGTIKCLIIIKLVNSSHLGTRLQDLPSIHLRTVCSIFFVLCINSCSLTVRDHGANIGSILFLLWSPLTEAPCIQQAVCWRFSSTCVSFHSKCVF